MELRHLRYFVAVAEELSFTRAAARLNIAQPPLSQQIRQLEGELGIALLRRSKHGVSLTAAGLLVLEESRRAIAQANRVLVTARRTAEGLVGHLNIGFSSSMPHTRLPHILRACRTRFPEITLTLHEHTTKEQIRMLADGQIDVGFLRLPLERSFPALVVKPVIREPLVVAMPKGHALGHCGAIPVRSLAEESFILLPPHAAPGLYDQIVGMCRSAGFQPRVAQEASQAQTIISLVSAGLGIAIVPASIQALQRDRVVYRKLRGPASMTAIAVGYEKDNHSMVLQRFLRVVNDATEK